MSEKISDRETTFVEHYLEKTVGSLSRLPVPDVVRLIKMVEKIRKEGRNLFLCGNGGSAATSSHLATELGKMASMGQSDRFRVYSLTDNVSWITALGNDEGFNEIFVEQLKNFAQPRDLLIAFSGSGNSKNVIKAVEWGNRNQLLTVGLTGKSPNRLAETAQVRIQIDATEQGQIEEGQFVIQHILSYFFMQ